MRPNFKTVVTKAILLSAILMLAVGLSSAQQVNLTAGPATLTLPDGQSLPMWGYSCGTASGATCAALNAGAAGAWSPVVITGPYSASTGASLTINLTNNLSFTPGKIPTSLVIVGQLGGGLGDVTQRTTTSSPDHSQAQAATTWPIAGTGASSTPPPQGPRVQ